MRINPRVFSGVLTLAMLSVFHPGVASASSILLTVDATAGPWDWTKGGLNDAFPYSVQDFSAPAIASLSALGLGAGDSVFIQYKSGLTSAFSGGAPIVDSRGYVGTPFKDNDPGSSGTFFPSLYMPSEWGSAVNPVDPTDPAYGVFLNALVGAFTDAAGAVIGSTPPPAGSASATGGGPGATGNDPGTPSGDAPVQQQDVNGGSGPFSVGGVTPSSDGLGPFTFVIPAGATQLQLGVNDDIFSDNTGALQVCVASSSADLRACLSAQDVPTAVPEPMTLTLVGGGLALGALRRRRSAK